VVLARPWDRRGLPLTRVDPHPLCEPRKRGRRATFGANDTTPAHCRLTGSI
jgi:hypothetical protein